eukprot:403364800
MVNQNLENYLLQNLDPEIQNKQIRNYFLFAEIVAIIAIYISIPQSQEVLAFLILIEQWKQPPITDIIQIPSSQHCPTSYTDLKAPFYGTNTVCILKDHRVKYSSCDKDDSGDEKNGSKEISGIYKEDYSYLGETRICVQRDPLKRTYYQLLNETTYKQGGLSQYNKYHTQNEQLANHIEFQSEQKQELQGSQIKGKLTLENSDYNAREPLIDVKLDFQPYPCLIEGDEMAESNERKISEIFRLPNNCKEKGFIDESRNISHLYNKVQDFELDELPILESNDVFGRIERKIPYRFNSSKLFNKNEFLGNHYSMYYQNYLKFSPQCNLNLDPQNQHNFQNSFSTHSPNLSIHAFVDLMKSFKLQQDYNHAINVIFLLGYFFTLWMNKYTHNRMQKLSVLGFVVYGYLCVMGVFMIQDRSRDIHLFVQNKCLPDQFAQNALLTVEEALNESKWFLTWIFPVFLIIKSFLEFKINL